MSLRRSTHRLLAATFTAAALALAACGDEPAAKESSASDPVDTPEQSDRPPSTPTAPSTPTTPTSGPTAIPDDFPLTSGWPEGDGSSEFQLEAPSDDNEAMLPAGDLDACDQPVAGGDPGDRLTTSIDWGSAQYVRELQLFADPDGAAAYLDSIQDAFAACEAAGPTTDVPSFTTAVDHGSVGEESSIITRASDGIGRVVINVVRVGNAVVVDLKSDEGTGDTVIDLATETRENLADVIAAAMCAFTVAGC